MPSKIFVKNVCTKILKIEKIGISNMITQEIAPRKKLLSKDKFNFNKTKIENGWRVVDFPPKKINPYTPIFFFLNPEKDVNKNVDSRKLCLF